MTEEFEVEVKVIKSAAYKVRVAAVDVARAEQMACLIWRESVGEGFDVDKPDTFEVLDTVQVTFSCRECEARIPSLEAYNAKDEMCAPCYSKCIQAEIDFWNETPERIHQSFLQAMRVAVASGRKVSDPATRKLWALQAAPQVTA